ncbi:GTP-binding protein HflX [Lihuaxuella thermophila]|uniref:GTPase HflX n=1 Tax=Lihuaxuella thermophila TaxID=1173111 RepID=A0A1H8GFZ3_9BACL|nr:GTP-binding protein HflX [Lihuaxuella thermophila]
MAKVIQFRDQIDPSWLIGRGKAEEIVQLAEEKAADLVIFDQELSPAQVRNLERLFPCKVIDRTQLILDIFAQRARTREGRLQVELAQLEYMLPRLAGRGKELSRLGGGIGTRGPGEKKLETDRRHIQRQIRVLKRELEEVKKHRQLHHQRRKKMDLIQVALVGYTNAGKSTLLNRLTGSEVYAENQLFATLDPTTRLLQLPSGKKVLLTDTVGFIRNLPHQLVAAFRSTLEQVTVADLLLHVVDASHPEAGEQMEAVEKVLKELGAAHLPILTVYNKADRTDLTPGRETDETSIHISAFDDQDILRLKEKIEQVIFHEQIEGRAEIPVERGEWISALYRSAEILSSKVTELSIQIEFRLPLHEFERLSPELKRYIRT